MEAKFGHIACYYIVLYGSLQYMYILSYIALLVYLEAKFGQYIYFRGY